MNLSLLLLLIIAAETSYLTARTFKKRADIPRQSILLDTSVLIDGRIEAIARSGLITSPLLIPQAVVRELQYMADKADHDKRERARQGLDMIDKLQHIEVVTVEIVDTSSAKETGVDELLVELAVKYEARLCTTDYNLNKAARVQGIVVLNINEIAHALRVVHLPGEIVTLVMQQAGQERDQGVGFLDDGTMVVVDNGKSHMNEAVDVEVTRVLQTVAGKMMFAKLVSVSQKQVQKMPKVFSGKALKKPSSQTTSKASMVANGPDSQTTNKVSMLTSAAQKPSRQTTSKASLSANDPNPRTTIKASMTANASDAQASSEAHSAEINPNSKTAPTAQSTPTATESKKTNPKKEPTMNPKSQKPAKQNSEQQPSQARNNAKPASPKPQRAPQNRKRKSMTDRAEDSLVNLLNNQ